MIFLCINPMHLSQFTHCRFADTDPSTKIRISMRSMSIFYSFGSTLKDTTSILTSVRIQGLIAGSHSTINFPRIAAPFPILMIQIIFLTLQIKIFSINRLLFYSLLPILAPYTQMYS